MVGIQLFATPAAKAAIFNGMVSTTYHVANLYRGRERYKVWLSIGLEGARWRVTGSDKKTGFEPFCQKWAKRFDPVIIAIFHAKKQPAWQSQSSEKSISQKCVTTKFQP